MECDGDDPERFCGLVCKECSCHEHQTAVGQPLVLCNMLCPTCNSTRCGIPRGKFCGLADEDIDIELARMRAEAKAEVDYKHNEIDNEINDQIEALARDAKFKAGLHKANEKAKANEDAKRVPTHKQKKQCIGDEHDCVFSQLKPGEPAVADGRCMFCDPIRLPKLAKTMNGKRELKRALNVFRNNSEPVYKAAKAKLACLAQSTLSILDNSFGNYCLGDGVSNCIFSSSKPCDMQAKTEGKGTCVWCQPSKFIEVAQNKGRLRNIVRALKAFKTKNKDVYVLAKARIPEEVRHVIEAAEGKTAFGSSAATRKQSRCKA